MAAIDVVRSLSLHPPSTPAATADSFRGKLATPEPHYRLSRLNPPQPSAPLRPPSIISRSVSAGMTFSFKKEKDKDKDREKDKDNRHHLRPPSPDGKPSKGFGFTLRKKVSLASLISSASTAHDDGASSSRSSSMSGAGHASLAVPPVEEILFPVPSLVREEDGADEDVHAPDRFVKKNLWRTRHKMKLHPYPDAPYMQAYDPVVLENERYTHYLMRRLAPVGSPTFHAYKENPPASVLDLGCGAGLWLLDAARTWRTTRFVGLDLVDVAVEALTDGSTPNVRLIRGDFLKYALPFPDHHFELVRMANLALCIPFPKWEYVLREAARVMAPGGRLELVDDQTFFPYGDAPIEEATEMMAVDMIPHLATTPTPLSFDPLSPSTPTPTLRAPPPTPEASAFFDSSDEEDEDDDSEEGEDRVYKDTQQEPEPSDDDDSDPTQPPTPDSASEHSSFNDAASTLVGSASASERGSLEFKKLSASGAPQLEFDLPQHRPFSGVEHLVISIPPPPVEPLAVVDLTVEGEGESGSESEYEGEMPLTPVAPPVLAPTPTPTSASISASTTTPTPTLTPSSASTTTPTPTPTSAHASFSTFSSSSSSSSAPPTPSADDAFPLPTAPETSAGPWSTQRAAARDMERVFVRMLATRYGLHTRPADVLLPMLARVFCAPGKEQGMEREKGRGRVERPASMHLKLAPVGVEGRGDVVLQERERERESLRAWMTTVEWEGKTPEREGGKEKEREGAARRPRMPKMSEPPVPQGVSAKAAERLGITVGAQVPQIRRQPTLVESPEGSEEEEGEFSSDEEGLSAVRAPLGRGVSTWVPPSEWDAPPTLSRENSTSSSGSVSASPSSKTLTAASSSRTITAAASTKTLKQLGIPPPSPSASSTLQSHSQPSTPTLLTHSRGGSTASAASAGSALSVSSGAWSESDEEARAHAPRFSTGHVQNPGLILWPATFIPVPPQELEMHATKHVQTLLGCKPALAEFVGTFVDPETGGRLVSEGEFEDAVWGYECFRRPRLNWPELPGTQLDGEEIPPDVPTPGSARSMHHAVPRTPTTEAAPKTPAAVETRNPFARDELTHVRTFRVFAAIKGGVASS
ncbi:hypothetical protein B0H19DRAFT_1268807 [Mycena capillaripes]|nr:hypothetical protein B0H19DRAFT_1268807 [Mycena capillaripes]